MNCEVGDLYRVPFDPALGDLAFDRERRGDTEAPVPADVLAQQDCVRRSDALALVFPLWWSDVPAILKGWFDRVWTKGFAYSPSGETELRRLSPHAPQQKRRSLGRCNDAACKVDCD